MNKHSSRLLWLLAPLLAIFLAGCQQTYFRALNAGLPETPVQSLVFDPSLALSLDVYRPVGTDSPAPVVVFFYGGSWRDGSRAYYRFVGEALAQRGILVLIPDYRKAPDHVFPAFMLDAATATAWARAHSGEFGGDPSRLFVMGHSAGAHMAALLGTDARYLGRVGMKPRELAGVIGLAGAYDFLPITEPGIRQVFGNEENWPDSQPINFVDGDEPPFLLMHGGSDRRVDKSNSEQLAARLQANAELVALRIVPRTGHIALVNGFRSARFSPVLAESLAWIFPDHPVIRTAPVSTGRR